MGSDVNHFNVSLIAQGKVTRQCPSITIGGGGDGGGDGGDGGGGGGGGGGGDGKK